jgi:hypothetical protein
VNRLHTAERIGRHQGFVYATIRPPSAHDTGKPEGRGGLTFLSLLSVKTNRRRLRKHSSRRPGSNREDE